MLKNRFNDNYITTACHYFVCLEDFVTWFSNRFTIAITQFSHGTETLAATEVCKYRPQWLLQNLTHARACAYNDIFKTLSLL